MERREIRARAEGRRSANPKPRYSPEAAERYADNVARQFGKKQKLGSAEVAIPVLKQQPCTNGEGITSEKKHKTVVRTVQPAFLYKRRKNSSHP